MDPHVVKNRLIEVADKGTRFTKLEFDHLEKCADCVGLYAKAILHVARTRAKKKSRKRSAQ
jgi:hypothetical protein